MPRPERSDGPTAWPQAKPGCRAVWLAVMSLALWAAPATLAAGGDNFFVWNWGGEEELQAGKVPRFEPVDRIGLAGTDGDTHFRLLKPNTFQVMMIVPAFDFDPANSGAVNHPFHVTVRFKDVSTSPTPMWAGKGGCGFQGQETRPQTSRRGQGPVRLFLVRSVAPQDRRGDYGT
jgi:hypothetical protein